ncbi:MAG: lytic transglycosylase domain-containing protein [Desulfobacterales bacterium]
MDEYHRRDKVYFVIISCLYIFLMAFVVSGYAPPEHGASDMPAVGAAMPDRPYPAAIEATTPKTAATKSEDVRKVEWISVWGKSAEKVFWPKIEEAAQQYNVEPELIKAIIWAESSFNPNAVSEKGAVGLMQLMPSTARGMGIENFSDPEANIEAGVRYFKQLLNQFDGDAKLALAAYNAGSRKVREYQGIPPFEATQFYVKKVFEYYNGFKQNDGMHDIDRI